MGRQDLDRDIATELGVVREIDLTHAAGAELAEDSIMEEVLTEQ